MPVDSPDVTVILTGHREGILIHRTLRSILRSIAFAQDRGIACDILAVLDRPDRATADYFARLDVSALRVLEVACGDPALARNRGAQEAAGRYVAFVDGDDLVSRNWISDAFALAEEEWHLGRRLVLHPELNVFFGRDTTILTHVDQESPEWSLSSLCAANYWTALAFVRREGVLEVPFRSSDPDTGFGYEDWDWNCLTVAAGMIHKVVPGTWHFIRLKWRGSRNQIAQDRDLLIQPSPLFDRLENDDRLPSRTVPDLEDDSAGALTAGMDEILRRPHLLAEWRELARIEPDLFPSPSKLRRYRFWKPSETKVGRAFGQILRQWGPAPSHVILCDRFGEGESGLTALNHVRALLETNADVLVVAERRSLLPLHYGGRGSLRMLSLDQVSTELDFHGSARLLARALLQRPPRTIHLIECEWGYAAIAAYGLAMQGVSRIFASVPYVGCARDGFPVACAARYFDRIAPLLSGLLSQSRVALDWFRETFGCPREPLRLVRGALAPGTRFRDPESRVLAGRPKAFWWGDHGQQSCPALLLQIAQLMPEWDFLLSTHSQNGFPWPDELSAALRAAPNVVWAPVGQSLQQVLASANALLHTSVLDGLPAIFIEASVGGVPIVAPFLRGIREFLSDDTGFPVRDYFAPEAYAASLRELLDEPGKTVKRVRAAQRWVRKEYSWRRFIESLQAVEGYL